MRKLEGKIAYVTGAASGIGRGIANVLAKHGAKVIVVDVSDNVRKVESEIKQTGNEAIGIQVDITKKEEIKQSVDSVIKEFGRIDILVNNAGVAKLERFIDMSDEVRDFHFNVNINGTWNCTKEILPHMIKQNYGKIVNTSSVTGMMVADEGETAYSVTKAALIGFTKSLAREVAENNITVNAFCPGYIMTPLVEKVAVESNPKDPNAVVQAIADAIPMKRLGKPEEAGELVAFLASDESRYITGTQVVIDGGSTLPETVSIGV